MRTMKRVAAVALSVVVLMTSGVSAKAAVTDVQPAKSKDEAVEKWVNKPSHSNTRLSLMNAAASFTSSGVQNPIRPIPVSAFR